MTDPLTVRYASLAALLFQILAVPGAFSAVPAEQMQAAKVVVESRDAQGRMLQDTLGFVLDENTVVTSYNAVKGASVLHLRSGDYAGQANRILSCSNFMDLALVKTSEEMPMDPDLAGSDTLAAGDPAYYFSRDKAGWRIISARVKSWRDSGQGYEMLDLEPDPGAACSPLFNAAGKVVGWISGGVTAPLKAIYEFFSGNDSAIPLNELNLEGKFWTLFRARSSAEKKDRIELAGMKSIQGTARFPFSLSLPGGWPFQTGVQPGRYLLMSMNGRFGITVALRVVPEESEDLMTELERVEALMLPGVQRAEMTPYSADHFTGMKAVYEDSDEANGYSTDSFLALSNGNLYVLTITYPRRYEEQIRPLIEEIIASFRIQV